jgi:hypothetical protein
MVDSPKKTGVLLQHCSNDTPDWQIGTSLAPYLQLKDAKCIF